MGATAQTGTKGAAGTSERRLEGRVALVFGAGSSGPGWGNGKATAVTFARHGARVVAIDIEPSAAEETRSIIRGEGFDCEESWHRVLDINLTSVFLTCKHVLPVMLRQKKGAIVNVSSLAAIRYSGYPYSSYYASKAGINQFTVGLAMQYAKEGIRANVIMPGMMNTPLIYKQIVGQYASAEDMVAARDAVCPMGRMGTAWEIANAALFLASDEASYVTGVCLPVDGGLSCGT